jgi:membrane protease YdiL (CAAX protease family)
VRQGSYPGLGGTAWLLAGTLLASVLLAVAGIVLFPGWPQIVHMALPTEIALAGAVALGARRTGLPWREAIGLRALPFRALAPIVLLLIGAVTVFSELYVVTQRVVPVPPEFEALLRDILRIDGRVDLVLTTTAAVVLAPILEEALFRGIILQGLARQRGPRAAALWTAAFFALFHFYNPWQILPTFFLGLLLAWVVMTTGSLWPSIVLHAAFNGLSLVVFAVPVRPPDAPVGLIVTGVVLLLLVGSAALLAGLAWLEAMTGGGAFAADYEPGAEAPPAARG